MIKKTQPKVLLSTIVEMMNQVILAPK